MRRYTIPSLPWLAQNHTITSSLRNSIAVCRKNNVDHNACKCAIRRVLIFNSECITTVCQPGSTGAAHTAPQTPSWISERTPGQGRDVNERRGKRRDGRARKGKRKGRRGGKRRGSIATLLFPTSSNCCFLIGRVHCTETNSPLLAFNLFYFSMRLIRC